MQFQFTWKGSVHLRESREENKMIAFKGRFQSKFLRVITDIPLLLQNNMWWFCLIRINDTFIKHYRCFHQDVTSPSFSEKWIQHMSPDIRRYIESDIETSNKQYIYTRNIHTFLYNSLYVKMYVHYAGGFRVLKKQKHSRL